MISQWKRSKLKLFCWCSIFDVMKYSMRLFYLGFWFYISAIDELYDNLFSNWINLIIMIRFDIVSKTIFLFKIIEIKTIKGDMYRFNPLVTSVSIFLISVKSLYFQLFWMISWFIFSIVYIVNMIFNFLILLKKHINSW